ncbi:PREDICTED: synaptotagmin-16 isoform X1 [Nicrophorus vespilloides]|uniref:Synaptotagmin-16 isoform X1 n=1 Tax=Nicrophorus vespilloides TaxID=110193 RepID=A0ABM1M0W7_NICVS|nr:PREDICTED: synaptotagmin-16 isoform X1 [Nicrophorus vespilloides]
MLAVSDQTGVSATDGGGGAILGAFAGICALIVVFLLYLNKRWWWNTVGSMGCCDESCPPVSTRPAPSPTMLPPAASTHPIKPKIVKEYSFDGGDSSSESEMGGPVKGGQQEQLQSQASGATGPYFPPRQMHDLISLVEKGRVGLLSSNSSCCSSTTSSVGERHGVMPTTKVTAQVSMNITRTPTSTLRETKIDNHQEHMLYQKMTEEVQPPSQPQTEHTDINSNRDCIVVMNTEGDGSELVSCVGSEPEEQTMSKCGNLEIALLYDAPMRKMTVHVLQAREIPSRDRGQPTHTQVRLLLLPSKKQKHKTKIRSGENPQYMESFLLHRVNPEDVNSMGIRLRLYGCERMRRERLIGESIVGFANINLELENNFWLNLEPRANTALSGCTGELMSLARSDSTGSTHSMQHGGVPELLLGLCYNATTGRLSVEVVKGSHFRNLALNRAPDTYVKLHLVSSTGQELAQSKTTIRRGQPNPLFKETFVFQVALFQLADVTLMVSIYNRRGVTKKKEMVGWFSLGLNSSGAEELAHWMDMKEFQQEQISRWHVLVRS